MVRRGLLAAACVVVVSCTSGGPASGSEAAAARAADRVGGPQRIAVVVLENREYDEVIGNEDDAYYINRLAKRFGLATQYYGITHPSLPNYLAMIGGSTFGIEDDCTDCTVHGRNLVDQLVAHHVSWKAYMQGLPAPCWKGEEAGDYTLDHNPFFYFPSIRDNEARCHRVVPFTQYAKDRASGRLPRFIWITPDRCEDGHDCGTWTSDQFVHRTVPGLLKSLGENGLLFLTYDEGHSDDGCCEKAHGGRIVTIVAGPGARRQFRSDEEHSHYSLLRTIENVWGFRHLGHAACECTDSLREFLRSSLQD